METKRVDLMPVGPVSQPKKDKKVIPTFRFNLTLTESTDKTCPEFSYTELMKNALGREEEEDLSVDPLDPFSKLDRQEEDKLIQLAKSFEEKYATGIKPSAKRKRPDHPGDLVDLGEGYDLEDPFIDNTEAYDEVIPSNMTTHLGGFYINSGALDFKYCSDDSEQDFVAPKAKKKRNLITSDSESEGGEKKQKKKLLGGVVKKKLKKSLSTDSENSEKLIKKKKKLVSSEKIKLAKLKKNRSSGYWKQHQQAATAGQRLANGNPTPVMVNGEGLVATAQKMPGENPGDVESQGRSTPAKQVTISVVEDIHADQVAKISSTPSSESKPAVETFEIDEDSSTFSSQSTQKPKLETVATLPDTLSLKTLSNIEKLKQAAKEKRTESGKSKFFSQDVNDMLLSVEKDTRQSSQAERSAVYSHLAGHLPCSKETLLKRGKKLLQEQQDDKLREPISKLKEAVIALMPALYERHAAECAAAQSKQQVKQSKVEKKEGGAGSSNESEEEGSNDGSEKPKRLIMPRKKFEWTPHLRQLLCCIVVLKMDHYEMSKVRSQSPEEYLKAFLDAEIKSLWPQGWIQTRMLFKESRSVHSKWTNPQSKPKKVVIPAKNTPNTVSTLQKTSLPSQSLTQAVTSLPKSSPMSLTQPSASALVTQLVEKPAAHATNHHLGLFASPELPHKTDGKSISNKLENAGPTLLDYAEISYSSKSSTVASNEVIAKNTSHKMNSSNGGTVPKNSGIIATSSGAVVKNTGAVVKNTGAVVKNTGAVVKNTGAVVKNSGAVVKHTGAVAKTTGTVARSTDGSLLKASGVSLVKSAQAAQMVSNSTASINTKKPAVSKVLSPGNVAAEKTAQDFLQKFKDFTSTFHQQFPPYTVQQGLGQATACISSPPTATSLKSSGTQSVADTSPRTKVAPSNVQHVMGASAMKTSQYSVKPMSYSSSLNCSVPGDKAGGSHQKNASLSSSKLTGGVGNEVSPRQQPKGPVISTIPPQLISSASSLISTTAQLTKASTDSNKSAVKASLAKVIDTNAKVPGNKLNLPVNTIKVVTTADGKPIRIANPIRVTTADTSVRKQAVPMSKPISVGGSLSKSGGSISVKSSVSKSPVQASTPPTRGLATPQSSPLSSGSTASSVAGGILKQKGTLPQGSKTTNQGLGAGILPPQQHKTTLGSQDRQQKSSTPGMVKTPQSQQQTIKPPVPSSQHASVKHTGMPKPPKPNPTSAHANSRSPVLPMQQATKAKPQPTSPVKQYPPQQNPRSPKSTFGGLSLEELQRQMLQKDYTQPQQHPSGLSNSPSSRTPLPQSPHKKSAFNTLGNSQAPYSNSPGNAAVAAAAFNNMLSRISSQGADPTGASPTLTHTSPSNSADRYGQAAVYGQSSQHSPRTSPSAGHPATQGLFPGHTSPGPTRPTFSPYGYGYPKKDPSQQQYRY